jgi:phage tail-like protein
LSKPDPEIAHRFRVEVDSVFKGGFTECSGLQLETEFDEVQVGGVNGYRHKLPKGTKYGNLVLRYGVVSDDLWAWYQKVVSGQVDRRKVYVVLMSADGTERLRWTFKDAFPVKWTGPDLKADSGAVAIEALEIAHHGLVDKGRRASGA